MLHYLERGSGTPVLLVHGFADSAVMWFASKTDLFSEYQVVAVDLPGHGQSMPWTKPKLTIHDMAEELDLLTAHLRIPPFILMGHSMGGMVAQQYCAGHPEKVTSLILCSTASRGSELNDVGVFNLQALKRDIRRLGLREALSADPYSAFGKNVDPDLVRKYLEIEFLTDPETAMKCLDAMESWAVEVNRSQAYRGQTIIVYGEEDKITPPACANDLSKAWKGSKIEIISRAGHMLYLEKPAELEDVLPRLTI